MRSIWIAGVLLLFCGCSGVRSAKAPYGFGPGDLVEGVPAGWAGSTGSPESTIVGIDEKVVHSGNASFVFQSRSHDDLTTFKQVVVANPHAGRRVRFRAYVRTNHLSDHAGLWMRADTKKRNAIVFDNMEDRSIKGTNDWQPYDIVLLIPEEAETLHFGIMLRGPGYSKRKVSRDRVLQYPDNPDSKPWQAGEAVANAAQATGKPRQLLQPENHVPGRTGSRTQP